MLETTINANVAECLKTMSHFGFSRVHNICTGAVIDVPWGIGDWIMGAFFSGLFIAMFLMILGMGILIVRDALTC